MRETSKTGGERALDPSEIAVAAGVPEEDGYAGSPEAQALSADFDNSAIEGPPDAYFGEEAATLGDRVAAARQAAGLTQAGLAARLGVGSKVVSAWENDRSEPRANRLAMLAGLLNVSVTWLLTGRGDGVDPPEAPAAAAAQLRPFQYVFAVRDLDACRRFYGDVLGCRLAATDGIRQDFVLYGHAMSAVAVEPETDAGADRAGVAASGAPEAEADPKPRAVDADGLPLPNFGVLLLWDDWIALIERIRQANVAFLLEPTIRFVGAPAEQGLFAVSDGAGGVLAFRAHRDPDQAFL